MTKRIGGCTVRRPCDGSIPDARGEGVVASDDRPAPGERGERDGRSHGQHKGDHPDTSEGGQRAEHEGSVRGDVERRTAPGRHSESSREATVEEIRRGGEERDRERPGPECSVGVAGKALGSESQREDGEAGPECEATRAEQERQSIDLQVRVTLRALRYRWQHQRHRKTE